MLEDEGEGVLIVGVAGAELRFSEECLGGDGGRVEEWCVGFVRSRDIEAVAVDVPNDATGGGERGRNVGRFKRSGVAVFLASPFGVCSSRILRRHCTERYGRGRSDDDEEGVAESSSIGGVIGRGATAGEWTRWGVIERERELDPRRLTRRRSEKFCDARFVGESATLAPRSVLVLLELLRLRNEKLEGGLDGSMQGGC